MAIAQEQTAKSQSFPDGIGHRRSVGDVRARKHYFSSLAACRSNMLDAADLAGPGVRDEILSFLRNLDAIAPTSESLDAAASRPATAADTPPRELSLHELIEAAGNGRSML